MANASVNPQAEPPATHTGEATPLFQPFTHYPAAINAAKIPGGAVRDFAERVTSISSGVVTILELALDDQQRKEMRETSDVLEERSRPLMEPNQVWNLQRLALAVLVDLAGETERLMKWAHENHTAEGKEATKRRGG